MNLKQKETKTLQTYRVHHLNDIKSVVLNVVSIFPKSYQKQVKTGVYELVINAIEHGNLGINWAEKSDLKNKNRYVDELNHRLKLTTYEETKIIVEYEEKEGAFILKITDEGSGFDWKPFVSKDKMSITEDQNHGAGIAMATTLSFDDIFYNEKGNVVTCLVKKQ